MPSNASSQLPDPPSEPHQATSATKRPAISVRSSLLSTTAVTYEMDSARHSRQTDAPSKILRRARPSSKLITQAARPVWWSMHT